MNAISTVDVFDLQRRVTSMYERVARNPHGSFHFEMGRELAERLGYDPAVLDRVPQAAIDSFAGVGHHFDLAELVPGEAVLDLGSGSGMDSFVASALMGPSGQVLGVDMTAAQRDKAESLRVAHGVDRVGFVDAQIDHFPFADGVFDVVISNGVINLAADKGAVFREAYRVLRPGGRLAISDIVTDVELPESISCDATLWAACIGGALQNETYQDAIESAGFRLVAGRRNDAYRFLSSAAENATQTYGVRSVSFLAVKA